MTTDLHSNLSRASKILQDIRSPYLGEGRYTRPGPLSEKDKSRLKDVINLIREAIGND